MVSNHETVNTGAAAANGNESGIMNSASKTVKYIKASRFPSNIVIVQERIRIWEQVERAPLASHATLVDIVDEGWVEAGDMLVDERFTSDQGVTPVISNNKPGPETLII